MRLPPLRAVEHLVGMQAQLPLNPYLGLWSRLEGFEPDQLAQLVLDRKVVRLAVMRATLHLVSADDCLVLRPLMQAVLDAEMARHRDFGPALRDVDLRQPLAFAREFLAEAPRSGIELRAAMAERFPDLNAGALAFACRNRLAFIQVPPRGVWGRSGPVRSTTAEGWLGRSVVNRPSIDDVLLRYLGAFGPATVADATTWCRLTGLREVFERLRPRLCTLRDESGRELFDLPDAPLPDPDVPAPPRFLPEYDNVLLSHADRTRFVSDEGRKHVFAFEHTARGPVLSDGVLAGMWWVEEDQKRRAVRLDVGHADPLAPQAAHDIEQEGLRLLNFLHPDFDEYDVRLTLTAA